MGNSRNTDRRGRACTVLAAITMMSGRRAAAALLLLLLVVVWGCRLAGLLGPLTDEFGPGRGVHAADAGRRARRRTMVVAVNNRTRAAAEPAATAGRRLSRRLGEAGGGCGRAGAVAVAANWGDGYIAGLAEEAAANRLCGAAGDPAAVHCSKDSQFCTVRRRRRLRAPPTADGVAFKAQPVACRRGC